MSDSNIQIPMTMELKTRFKSKCIETGRSQKYVINQLITDWISLNTDWKPVYKLSDIEAIEKISFP